MAVLDQQHPADVRFRSDALRLAEDLRGALVALVEAVCGGTPRAQDITDRFGVHRKLGWQIWNVAYDGDALLATRFLPSERSFRAWLEAAGQAGVDSDLVARSQAAHQAFERFVETHATDRELREMLVDSSAPEPSAVDDVRWRKQAFTGNSFVFGVRARTLLGTLFLHPSARRPMFDMARVQGMLGLIRTRGNVRWPFSQSLIETGDEQVRLPRREPVSESLPQGEGEDAREWVGRVPLMAEFCSVPAPPVQRRLGSAGMVEDELLPGPVGQLGETTIITGELLHEAAPAHGCEAGELAYFGTGVRTPAELLISDHFVHRDLFPGVPRELVVFSELISPTTRDERDRLPVSERVQSLGRGLARIRTAEVPRYEEIVRAVMRRAGWNADEFDVFRVRMKYPPIPTSVMLRFPLPAPPAKANGE